MITVEKTKDQKLRDSSIVCLNCGQRINVGSNYPTGIPVPRTLELFCRFCTVINVYYSDNFPLDWADK